MIGADRGFRMRLAFLATFVALTGAVFVFLLNIAGGVQVGDRYRVTVVVPTAVQLSTNADVTTAGVRIGRVEAISNRGATAVLRLALDPGHAPVHRDARVQVRAKTLVGENYVDLEPGSPGTPRVPDGGELPIERAAPTTQLEDVLDELTPARRRRLSALLSGLGRGVADTQVTGRAVTGIGDLLAGGKAIVDPLDAERTALRSLVADLGTVFGAVGERGDALRNLVAAGRRAATSLATEEASLRASLRELPRTLAQARRTTTRVAVVGDQAVPVLDDLTPALRDLTPVMEQLPRVGPLTLRALRALRRAAPTTRAVLSALRRLGRPGAAAIPPLDAAIREIAPALRFLAPYSADAGSFFAGLGQSVSAYDATGHIARLQPVLSPAALTTLGESERKAIDTLLGLGIGRLVNMRGVNHIPQPGTLANPRTYAGDYPGLKADGPGR